LLQPSARRGLLALPFGSWEAATIPKSRNAARIPAVQPFVAYATKPRISVEAGSWEEPESPRSFSMLAKKCGKMAKNGTARLRGRFNLAVDDYDCEHSDDQL
jgi:hypothetical protein